ncbi:ester cyclase [Sphingobacteriaceae bacterium]|nr:ester cyclase [Sphingobacteriaceae bacterium]
MKKIILYCVIVAGVSVTFSSFTGSKLKNQKHFPNHKTMINKNKEVIRKLYEEALNRRNYSLLKQLVSEDYIGPRGEKGAEGMEGSVKPLIVSFPEVQWKIEDLLEEGDKVVVRWYWQATHKETYQGITATNRLVKSEAIAIYVLKDEKIIGATMITDRLGFLMQLGVILPEQLPGNQSKK